MNTTVVNGVRMVLIGLAALALAATGASAAKGGNPGPPSGTGGDPHKYEVAFDVNAVFTTWTVVGVIQDDQDSFITVNARDWCDLMPTIAPDALEDYCLAECPSDDGDWETCFPLGGYSGTIQFYTSGAPGFRMGFTASNRTGRDLWYLIQVDAESLNQTVPWDPYHQEVGEDHAVSIALTGWRLAAGTGKESKGCVASGDFGAGIVVTVTRLPDDQAVCP